MRNPAHVFLCLMGLPKPTSIPSADGLVPTSVVIHAMASGLTRPFRRQPKPTMTTAQAAALAGSITTRRIRFWRRVRRWILTGDHVLVVVAYGLLAAVIVAQALIARGVIE